MMKYLGFFLFVVLLGCERSLIEEKNIITKICQEDFDENYYLSFTNKDIIFGYNKNRDSLSNVYFVDIEKDCVLIKTKKVKLFPFSKDILKRKNEIVILSTIPRTLGRNTISTDYIVKYDENLKITEGKDMNISKYPSGNSFIMGNDSDLFYITDGFDFGENPKLVISKLGNSFEVLNQNIIERTKESFANNPIQAIFIENVGITIASDLSYNEENNSTFKIEMFDLNLSKKWSENLKINSIDYLGYSKLKNRIFLISKKESTQINFWDYEGKKLLENYVTNNEIIDVTYSEDSNIYILERTNEDDFFIVEIDFLGKVKSKKKLSLDLELIERNMCKLIYKKDKLLLIYIDNFNNFFAVNRIQNNMISKEM